MPGQKSTKTAPDVDRKSARIPLQPGHWWPIEAMRAAERRAEAKGIRKPGVRDLTAELNRLGCDATEDDVGRCLRGEIVTWKVAVPLSKILGIPAPAVIPATMEEAVALDSGDEVKALLAKLQRLR